MFNPLFCRCVMIERTDKKHTPPSLNVALPLQILPQLDELLKVTGKTSVAEVVKEAVDFYYRFHAVKEAKLLNRLTPRLREVLQLVSEGNSSKEIATRLGISVKTVEMHRTQIMRTLEIQGIAR